MNKKIISKLIVLIVLTISCFLLTNYKKEKINYFNKSKVDTVFTNSEPQFDKTINIIKDEVVIYKPTSLTGNGNNTDFEFDHGLTPLTRPWDITEEMKQAFMFGAEGKITVRVVDSTGVPIENAKINSWFWMSNSMNLSSEVNTITDTNGIAEFGAKNTGEMSFNVQKNGCYYTRLRYLFGKPGYDNVKNNRWIPWNPMLEVVLKEKRNPVKMMNKEVFGTKNLPRGVEMGFDCIAGDWVQPHGKGEESDIVFLFESEYGDVKLCFTNSLRITAGEGGGVVSLPKDTFSQFWTVYEASENGYEDSFLCKYERSAEKIFKDVQLGNDRYLVFKTRIKTDENGSVVSSNYGKMIINEYQELFRNRGTGYVNFVYWFNLTPNDRNLENDDIK